MDEFTTRGVRLAAISVDAPEVSREVARKEGYTFPLLSDPGAETIRRYDLLHPGAGPEGRDIARPAEFLLDSGGTVRWANLTQSIVERARPEQALRAIDDLGLAPTASFR